MEPDLDSVLKILQASISPIAIMSGIGLLLLSQTNRFSRVTDRLRELARERREQAPTPHLAEQIAIFYQRARILRAAITAAVGCMLMASLMVLLLFGTAVLHSATHTALLLLFALSILCLITSLLLFLWDMRLSLSAVQRDIEVPSSR